MTDAEVIAAIRAQHLKANIAGYEAGQEGAVVHWDKAWVDPGGTIFGPGPYAKVPISFPDPAWAFLPTYADRQRWREQVWDIVVRVYPPKRLRERLAAQWEKPSRLPGGRAG